MKKDFSYHVQDRRAGILPGRCGEGEISNHKLLQIKKQMADISEYVLAIKQTFSRWYNKKNKRTGYFWGDRFKGVLIEKREALINCSAAIQKD